MPGLKEEVFEILRENLLAVKPEYASKDVVLCPLCLREITRVEALVSSVEHIIPQVATKGDTAKDRSLATKNQRCGITLSCRREWSCKSDGYISKDGCNGLKGRL